MRQTHIDVSHFNGLSQRQNPWFCYVSLRNCTSKNNSNNDKSALSLIKAINKHGLIGPNYIYEKQREQMKLSGNSARAFMALNAA